MFTNKTQNQMSVLFPSKIKKKFMALIATSAFISGCGMNGNADNADPSYYNPGSLVDAVTRQDLATVEKILQQLGYDVNEVNEQKENAILIATHLNNFEIAHKLIDAGANVNMQDEMKDNAYLYAAAQGRTEILRYILTQANPQPNPNVYNRFGGNALISAAEKGYIENVRMLLEDGRVDINWQNNFGYTALIEAVALKDGSELYQDIVKLLLDAGAKIDPRDKTGKSALDYAEEREYHAMIEVLTAAAQKAQSTEATEAETT